MTVITLTTDLGASSPAAGRLSGIIWRILPEAQIVDLTHEIPPRDARSAQLILENALPFFPEGTVHMAAVSTDPVGAETGAPPRLLVARLGHMLFSGPDTGLITPLLERAEANRWQIEVYQARLPEDKLPANERSMHAVSAALAALLARGAALAELGERINDPLRASIPDPVMLGDGWRGEVIQIDHFGNLAANIKLPHLEGMGPVLIQVGGQVIEGLSRTFGSGQPGDLIALIDSANRLSICVVNGSAAERLNARPGDPIEVQPRKG